MIETLSRPETLWAIGLFLIVGSLLAMILRLFGVVRGNHLQERKVRMEITAINEHIALSMSKLARERDREMLAWNGIRKFKIVKKVVEAADISSLYLAPHDEKPLPPYLPGQYLTFNVWLPNSNKAIKRCYSLSGDPDKLENYRVTVKKISQTPDHPPNQLGGVSIFFNDELQEGNFLDIQAPSGQFILAEEPTQPIVLIGSGIGITPVFSMLLVHCRSNPQTEVWFFLGVRNGQQHIWKEELQKLEQENPQLRLCICYSQPEQVAVKGRDFHFAERISVDLLKRTLPSSNYRFYLCGPTAMMSDLTSGLQSWGVPREHVHLESFGPSSLKKTSNNNDGAGKTVKFIHSGKELTWAGDGKSVLELGEENGVPLDSGCRSGHCGACKTKLKSGKVEYLDEIGVDVGAGEFLPCISIPATDLQVDA